LPSSAAPDFFFKFWKDFLIFFSGPKTHGGRLAFKANKNISDVTLSSGDFNPTFHGMWEGRRREGGWRSLGRVAEGG
jgi:hypothetical protein